MLNLSIYVQGSRGIIVAVQVGAVKIYVAGVEALKKKQSKTLYGFLSFTTP
jgi:hypothetical protein